MMTVRIFFTRRKYGIDKTKKADVVVTDKRLIETMISMSRDCPRFEDLRRKRMLNIPVLFRDGEYPVVAIDESVPHGLAGALTVAQVMSS